MKPETAQALVEAANEVGIEAAMHERYSGRSMFGKTTTGIVVSRPPVLIQLAAVAAARLQEEDPDGIDAFLDDLGRLSQDNMGHDVIVY